MRIVLRRGSRPELRGSGERTDRGATLIELLISVVLMGVVVVAVLVALQTTVMGSRIDREQANTYAWLQAASDEIYRGPRISCWGNTRDAVIDHYDGLAGLAEPPPGWASTASLSVTNVQFLGRNSPDGEFEWADDFCFESDPDGLYGESPLYTQKVTIVAVAPGGLTKTMETIKSE